MSFTTAAALVHELMEARDDRRLLDLQRQLSHLRLLIIDELGFVPLSATGGNCSSRKLAGNRLDYGQLSRIQASGHTPMDVLVDLVLSRSRTIRSQRTGRNQGYTKEQFLRVPRGGHICHLAACVARARDMVRSGWWGLVVLIPLLGWLGMVWLGIPRGRDSKVLDAMGYPNGRRM